MHLTSASQSEIQITLETLIELINGLDDDHVDTRTTLNDAGFSRADKASAASVRRLDGRLRELQPLIERLPDEHAAVLTPEINEEITELPIAPSIVDHDDVGPHLHWTPTTATFDDQVIADVLMALANELCDNGTTRFGRCDATDCARLFYDNTRNRSRRFCSDSRCASRTHTADHRARQSTGS